AFGDKDKQVIASLCNQIHGHPMRIVQIALEVKERELSLQTLVANPPKYIGRDLVQRFDSLYDRLPDSCQITLAVIGNLDTATLRVDLIRQVAQISMKDLQLLEDQHLIHFHLDRHRFTVHELVRRWRQDRLDNSDDDLRKKEFLKRLQLRIAEFYCQLLKKSRSGKPEDLREIDAEWPNILGLVDKIS